MKLLQSNSKNATIFALCLANVCVVEAFTLSIKGANGYRYMIRQQMRPQETSATTPYFVNDDSKSSSTETSASLEGVVAGINLQHRTLGSQEHLMLPRQYSVGNEVFPQMSHVSCTVLNNTPSTVALKQAINSAIKSHPMLRAGVTGTGEPTERIDLFKMVRSGEPDPLTFQEMEVGHFAAENVLSIKNIVAESGIDADKSRILLQDSWKERFNNDLDLAIMDVTEGPLWRIELHRFGTDGDASDDPCALLLTFNHAISDQSSANLVMDEILMDVADIESVGSIVNEGIENEMPRSLEENVLGTGQNWAGIGPGGISFGTLKYVAGKAAEGLKNPVILPDDDSTEGKSDPLAAITTITGRAAGGESASAGERRSTLQFRTLDADVTLKLLQKCRDNGVTMTNALSAAVTLSSTDFIAGGVASTKERNYKVLQSLDMRRFGSEPDKCESVSCQAGSMDLMLGPLKDYSGEALRLKGGDEVLTQFWKLAKEGKDQTKDFIESDGPKHAVRIFDFAMTIADLNNLVHLTAKSESSKGRAYSAGISNVGVYERQQSVKRTGDSSGDRDTLKATHGRYKIEDIFFATSHAKSGCLYQVSCMTVNGEMKFTFHPASPIVNENTNEKFADAFMDLIQVIAGGKDAGADSLLLKESIGGLTTSASSVPSNALSLLAFSGGLYGIGIHASAWEQFISSVQYMKDTVPATDFWAAVNFWIFFAVGHPLLQPILWISDVLHGTPGPRVADLVPALFLLGNAAAIYLVSNFKEIRNALNIATVFAFISYVGAGLDGTAGLGDFNLQLDDDFQGKVVKGCPSYEDVRQPSMDNFDLKKYQGKWYEHKFHDWTQFKEVYDTTLDIKLTEDGKGWVDDFGVKGPAPKSAILSWDKSPVANGAHYFMLGRVDEKDPPGLLRESGFGVEFPNYIVDVKTDPETGEYKEAIQFQCLERGGVRVFEGINFMSRSPVMNDEELTAMHARAEKAGMYPFGASPEQMHRVARRGVDVPDEDVDNTWQAMWRAIGVDKLLELLTESIEDGGR